MKSEENINVTWEICVYINMYYARYLKKIVTKYIVLINGVIISSNFQSNEIITLIVTEGGYSSDTALGYKTLYICGVLISYGISFLISHYHDHW